MTKNYKILNDCRGMYEQDIFDTIIAQRHIDNPERFFNPTEDDLLPLDSLKNIDKAFLRVEKALQNNENIAILFDTDTDGVAAGTIITRYSSNFTNNKIVTFIDEGKQHGLIGQDLEKFLSFDLLIIVDSLDKNTSQYEKLKQSGVDIIILDHHAINPKIPYDDVSILVSSQRDYDNSQLSGAGVTWKFCKYFDAIYGTTYADELVDLAACGIIADMMDMTVMENRYIVSKGLECIYNLALKKIVGGFEFNSTAISFSVAPIINASNRMNQNNIAMKAFLEDDNKQVLAYIKQLKKCKEDQKKAETTSLPGIIEQCENQINKKMIVAYIDTPYGVSGLLGNKLLEKYQRPILVIKDIGDEFAGSMRAIGLDDFRVICNDSHLASAEGHELASGITIKKSNLNKFSDYIESTLPPLKRDTVEEIDIQIDISDMTRSLVSLIKKIDRISGTNFKPVKVFIDGIEDYTIGQMSDYKHLVVKPTDYIYLIKWNFDGNFEEMEDHALMNDEIEVIGNLDSGFFGRKFVLKTICDEIKVIA